MSPHKRTKRLPPALMNRKNTTRMGVALVALVAINIYVFFLRDGTSYPDVRDKALAVPSAKSSVSKTATVPNLALEAEANESEPDGHWIDGAVRAGDSVGGLLKRAGLGAKDTDQLIRALRGKLNFRRIRAGQNYRIYMDASGAPQTFEFHESRITKVVADRSPRANNSQFRARKIVAETTTKRHAVGGTITSSLYAAIKSRGEDTALVGKLSDVFAYDLNFFIDQHKGDQFKLLVEKEYLGGDFLRYRQVAAAEWHGRAGKFQAFYFRSSNGRVKGYFDSKGRSVEKTFLKTPLKYSRISSKFSRSRMHPVLHRKRAHLGVDFAAPTGTPIRAAAAGKIVYRGWKGGRGNSVTLRHPNGMETIYMHMSKFRKGQRVGQRVTQRSVIGYVGMTGLATGPHLHFSVKQNGRYIDPLKLKMARGASVPRAYRSEFQRHITALTRALAAVKTDTSSVL